MWLSSLFANDWVQDLVALFITFAAALSWLRLTDFLALKRLVSRDFARKLIHIGTGPLFVLCWNLFSGSPQSRWLAALVPATITLQFALIGLGMIDDLGAVQAMSRSGNPRELLYGPVQYGLIFVALTLAFWLQSPVGVVALMILCGGDGLADVVGRRLGGMKLPFNQRKSWAGSVAMLVGGFGLAMLFLVLFSQWGVWTIDPAPSWWPLLLISLAAAVVEAVSPPDLDNLTLTGAALGMAWLLTAGSGLWDVAFLG